jgi:uncharacterized protein (TIGR04255 family)
MKVERNCRNVVFSNQPLVLVLAQLRFSPLAKMEEYIPAIQDTFRKEGFPYYSVKEGFGLEISTEGVKQNKLSQWFFETPDHRTSFLIDTGQVVFQTTAYQNFEHFMGQFLLLTEAVLQITKQDRLGILQRLGLRFINLIRGEDWRVYLKESFQGASSSLLIPDTQLFAQMTMGKVRLPEGKDSTFVLRLHQSKGGDVLPPDLMAFAPMVAKDSQDKSPSTIIDMDHFWEGSLGPGADQDSLATTFYALHDTIIEVFHQSVISEEAVKRWS